MIVLYLSLLVTPWSTDKGFVSFRHGNLDIRIVYLMGKYDFLRGKTEQEDAACISQLEQKIREEITVK